jgi:hypothetical protein
MPRKAKPKPGDPKRTKRLIETARENGADEGREEFERAFKKMFPRRHPSTKRRNRPRHTGS